MTPPSTPRRRDSAASRDRLLSAAGELFSSRGYDRTTAREIGDKAGVDPTMIARYFGGKAQLFVAVLRAEGDPSGDLFDRSRLGSLLERTARQGPGPVIQAAIRPYSDPAAQAAAIEELRNRVVKPLRDRLAAEGDEHADLRADVLTAAFIGVVLGRGAGTFEHLGTASSGDIQALLEDLFFAAD